MAEEVAEITSEENSVDEDELELTLGLRPINHPRPSTTFQKLPQLSDPQNAAICTETLSKSDPQNEARKKRDLKRKANHHQNNHHRTTWLPVEERECNEQEAEGDACCKAVRFNASYCAPPSWWSWNPPPAAYAGGARSCFRPYQGQNGKIPPAGQNVEGRDGENRQSLSTGSSSGISDSYQSTSGLGGNNSSADAGSHSGQSHSQLLEPITSSQADLLQPSSSSCNQTEHVASSTRSASKSPEGVTSSSTTVPEGGPASDKGHTSAIKGETTGKPPKPNGQTSQQKLMLSQMPCVSATGNGPNGKTITGFLYRYSKAEVSIVCVCHGASFSPAGFVEHAGGVDVEHPLRHIRVVPFALG